VSLTVEDRDRFEARLAVHASGLLAEFNDAGVLAAADVHVARQLASLAGERDPSVLLAIALAVRAPRLGHVLVDLAAIRATAAVDAEAPVDLETLAWPEPQAWLTSVTASALVAVGDEAADAVRPLRLVGSWLYLDRYWAEELQVAASLTAMGADEAPVFDMRRLSDGLARMFGVELGGRQSLAAASAVLRRFAVVAGGPGTGKTTTVARIVALLCEQAAASGSAPPLIALAAPTGKAAARLQEAVGAEAEQLEVDGAIADQLLALQASTLHRLLGWRPGSASRFRHHRNQRLPHDVVIVDETSMVSLSLMARLIEALRADARLVLVGDPGQLASIEAGAVLGDIVGPAADGPLIRAAARERLSIATGHAVASAGPPAGGGDVGDGIVVLDRGHRFGGGIAELAGAIRAGDADAVLALLREPPDDVRWIEVDLAGADDDALQPIRARALRSARTVIEAARAGSAVAALDGLAAFRILCAHRRGPYGVATWTANMESWLEAEVEGFAVEDRWYVGRPLLVNENDYELRLNNGDTGVIMNSDQGRVVAAFPRSGATIQYSPSRLSAVETVYAMTIHKSQGSQFDAAAVLLPEPDSRILTRELLYTAATRARRQLIMAGTEAAIRAAVQRPVARASGLRWRLWHD
jgi:exodeoxyribonuclease V alpha subunit